MHYSVKRNRGGIEMTNVEDCIESTKKLGKIHKLEHRKIDHHKQRYHKKKTHNTENDEIKRQEKNSGKRKSYMNDLTE